MRDPENDAENLLGSRAVHSDNRWPSVRLGELGARNRPVLKAGPFGSAITKDIYVERGFKVYGQQEVVAKDINAETYYVTEGVYAQLQSCAVEPGDILITMMGTVGRVFEVPEGAPPGVINPRLMRISIDRARAAPAYIASVLESPPMRRLLERRAHGGTMPGLNAEALGSISIPLPPITEQRKIAEILRTWGEAIEKLEARCIATRKRLTGISQQLLGHAGAFPERWPRKQLGAIASRVRRVSDGGEHPVMTISAKSGFLMQSDKFARDMAGSSVERYTLLRAGEFAYNKGNSLTAPYGCIFPLTRPTALVPFVYFCFALDQGLDHAFYAHLFAAGALNRQLSRLINSGVRNDGLLNLDPDDFFSCEVPVPPLDDQKRVAAVLTAGKEELELLGSEIEVLTRQKRGLMQKLLTGEWLVKVGETDQ